MKLFSLFVDSEYRYYHKNLSRKKQYSFLVSKNNVKDLIWMNKTQLKIIDSRFYSSLLLEGFDENSNLVSRKFKIDPFATDDYYIGFGCLVFKEINKMSYKNLIDFNPNFLFIGIL
jgi:hypothetical protein